MLGFAPLAALPLSSLPPLGGVGREVCLVLSLFGGARLDRVARRLTEPYGEDQAIGVEQRR